MNFLDDIILPVSYILMFHRMKTIIAVLNAQHYENDKDGGVCPQHLVRNTLFWYHGHSEQGKQIDTVTH